MKWNRVRSGQVMYGLVALGFVWCGSVMYRRVRYGTEAIGEVVELVYTQDLKSWGFGHAGSSPAFPILGR